MKLSPPFTANVLPKVRVTASPVSALKVSGLFPTVVIRASSLSTASPTLVTFSLSVLPSFVTLYVGPVNTPFSTLAPPPSASAILVSAACN